MPPTRKRRSRNNPGASEVVAPGGGTQADVDDLAKKLGLGSDAVSAMLNCEGSGVASSRSSRSSSNLPTAAPVASSAWADFMSDEGFGGGSGSAGGGGGSSASDAKKSGDGEGVAKKAKTDVSDSKASGSEEVIARKYVLPILTKMRPPSQTEDKSGDESPSPYNVPGVLAQSGTLDSKIVGRTKRTLSQPYDLQEPTILCFDSCFKKQKVSLVATSSSAVHSIVITEDGTAYSWGRNEQGQCGLGNTSTCVPLPVQIEHSAKFAGAAVGKSHSILIDEDGNAYAVGNNKYGQLGVNTSVEAVLGWRKCTIVGKSGDAKIVQVSLENAQLEQGVVHCRLKTSHLLLFTGTSLCHSTCKLTYLIDITYLRIY